MRKLIFSVSVGGGDCFKHCVDSQKKYAKKVGSEYKCITQWINWNDDLKTDSEKRNMVTLLESYDKVLYLDADVFIKEDASDIFEQYKDDNNLVIYNETMYNGVHMDQHIEDCIKKNNIKGWKKSNGVNYDWLNAGVILATKGQGHDKVFSYRKEEFFKFDKMPLIYDMPYMHKNIYDNDIKITFMDEKYNTMVYFHDNGDFLHFANVLDRDKRIKNYV